MFVKIRKMSARDLLPNLNQAAVPSDPNPDTKLLFRFCNTVGGCKTKIFIKAEALNWKFMNIRFETGVIRIHSLKPDSDPGIFGCLSPDSDPGFSEFGSRISEFGSRLFWIRVQGFLNLGPNHIRVRIRSGFLTLSYEIILTKLKFWSKTQYIYFLKPVAEAYTTQPNSKASSRVLYNIFESTCGG